MANLLISRVCNLNCPYCFAGESRQARFISPEDFNARLDLLERSHVGQARLLGGEPSLHPQFPRLLRMALERGCEVLVFTNGWLPPESLQAIEEAPTGRCKVLVNLNASRQGAAPDAYRQQRMDTLRRLGKRAWPGFTMDRAVIDFEPLLQEILSSGCNRMLRLGLAHPSLSFPNQHLLPREYPQAGSQIAVFARRAADCGVVLEFDCGFVPCMFSDEELQSLRDAGAVIHWRCSPVLDIDLDGQVYACFPLADRIKTDLENCPDAAALRAELDGQLQLYRAAGIYRDCSLCAHFHGGECSGGCRAHVLKRFRPVDILVEL